MSYLFTYTLRKCPRVLPSSNLEPKHAEVLSSLRAENRPYFDDFTRGPSGPSISWKEHILHRKEVLERLGYVQFSVSLKSQVSYRSSKKHKEARRPFPLPHPGNSELLRWVYPKLLIFLFTSRPSSVSASSAAQSTTSRATPARLIRWISLFLCSFSNLRSNQLVT